MLNTAVRYYNDLILIGIEGKYDSTLSAPTGSAAVKIRAFPK